MTGILKQPTMKSQKARLKMKQLLVVLILEDFTAIVKTKALPGREDFIRNKVEKNFLKLSLSVDRMITDSDGTIKTVNKMILVF